MMRLLAAGAVTVGGSIALSLLAKATAVTALARLAGWLTRRQRAAVRHLIFAAVFAVLALLPAVTAVMPAVPVPVRLWAMPVAEDVPPPPLVDRIVEFSTSVAPRPSEPRASRRAWPALSTVTLLETLWLVGMTCCFVPVALGLWQIRRVRRQGLPWPEAQSVTNELAHRARFPRPIEVMVHESVTGPMTCGVVRPAVVFPRDARTWCEADVRRALTHELEHVRRSDWVTLCLARAVCAVYWFHPLVWIANRQLCVNAERACDDAVLQESYALGYADQLVAVAEHALAETRRPLLAMANRGDLSTRVRAVLNASQRRGPAGMRARITVTVAAMVSLVLLAPLRTVASAQTAPAGVRLVFDVASIKPSFSNGIMNVRPLAGRLAADATLQILMQRAYGVQAFQVVGGPDWLSTDRYEIDARAGEAVSRDQLALMLQSLLEDRFRLKTHREIKELPVFLLVSDRGGFRLPAPKEGACVDSAADAALEWAGGRMAVPGELPPARGRCGSVVATLGQLRGGKVAMSELVRMLSLVLERSVLDRTGFTAPFDVQLDFVADDTTPALPPPPPGSGISGLSLAQALREQLGLRLEPAKGAVEMIVVEQAERPSAN